MLPSIFEALFYATVHYLCCANLQLFVADSLFLSIDSAVVALSIYPIHFCLYNVFAKL